MSAGAGPSAPGGLPLGSELMTLALGRESGGILRLPSWESPATFGASKGPASGTGPLAGREGARCLLRRCLLPLDSFELVLQAGMLGVPACFRFLLLL